MANNSKTKNKIELDTEYTNGEIKETLHVKGRYQNWFLEYASYVILERAIPNLFDGLKPVQRRILHSMKRMDDGRYNKVANIIGHTMQFHPHGDAAIGDAIVNLGQKNLLIDTQGNWGDVRTGDSAAASRYIEARLSKFALETSFNAQTTEWQQSYDGRQQEPVLLPVKFPLLLAQGAEGIAVGLATKIMPHNFIELIEASINVLKGKEINLLPDFPAGGLADFSNYNEGLRGGKVRLRANIDIIDRKTLVIRSVPYGINTGSLMDSIVRANDAGKIKLKKIVDNTAKHVEILIDLPPNVSPDITIDALFAFTDCEISISPNCCVIVDEKPKFLSINEILKLSTKNTLFLLKWELEIKQAELLEKLFYSSLEKIFIENRIYRDIEECETWEDVLATIDKGLGPFKKQLLREVTEEDLVRLTEIKIKRISKYNSFKADELMRSLQDELDEVKHNLANLIDYAIKYFENLRRKYGKGRERTTEIRSFDNIESAQVAADNSKLYINRKEGFVGHGLKKDDFICDCSDIDDIIVFLQNGRFKVVRISDKTYVGKDIIHAAVWKKADEHMVYNMIYYDAGGGKSYAKRFKVTSITRDREYDLTKGAKDSKVHYFTANPNGESEIVKVHLSPNARAKIKVFNFDFGELAVKGRSSQGNILTKYAVRSVSQKEAGASTLGAREIWFDSTIGRLNTDNRGKLLGTFDNGDSILVIYKDGNCILSNYDLNNHYDIGRLLHIEKFQPDKTISAVYYDGISKNFFVKRFKIETAVNSGVFKIITDHKQSVLLAGTTQSNPIVEIEYLKGKANQKVSMEANLNEIVDIKGWKAKGNRLSTYRVTFVELISDDEPRPFEVAETEETAEAEEIKKPNENKESPQTDLFKNK